MPLAASVPPFTLRVTGAARKRFADTDNWLRGLPEPFGGDEVAARFSESLNRELTALCQDIAERFALGSNLPRIDEEASLAFSRPAYKHTFTTSASGKRTKRQTTGVWFLFYDLPDKETLQVLFLRHSAAEPLTADYDRRVTGEANE